MTNKNKNKLVFATMLILAFGFIAATPLMKVQSASAQGLNNEKNFGQCKKDFSNGNGCNSTVKPGAALTTSGQIIFVDNNGANPPANKGHNNCHCG